MYWTDSPTGNIYAFDYDAATGNISNQRVFWHTDVGGPDGHAMDVEGNLWVAVWGGWKVVRVSPEGKVTAEIEVPTRCPTVRLLSPDILYVIVLMIVRPSSLWVKTSILPVKKTRKPTSIPSQRNGMEEFSGVMLGLKEGNCTMPKLHLFNRPRDVLDTSQVYTYV